MQIKANQSGSVVAEMAAWRERRVQGKNTPSGEQAELPLYGGGGGGGPMDSNVALKDYIDARDDAIESRLSSKLDRLPTKATVWGAAGTALGIILAILAFGSDRFNGGLSVSPLVAAIQGEQRKTDEDQDAKLQMMDRKLDILIERSIAKKP